MFHNLVDHTINVDVHMFLTDVVYMNFLKRIVLDIVHIENLCVYFPNVSIK